MLIIPGTDTLNHDNGVFVTRDKPAGGQLSFQFMLQHYMVVFPVHIFIRSKGNSSGGNNDDAMLQLHDFLFRTLQGIYRCLEVTHEPVDAFNLGFSKNLNKLMFPYQIDNLFEIILRIFPFQSIMDIMEIPS